MGFLYMLELSEPSLFLELKMSKKGRQPFFSVSTVNLMLACLLLKKVTNSSKWFFYVV